MTDRNRVRVESNERIDKPDWEAMQLGAHLAVRYALRGLALGTDAGDDTIALSTWTLTTVGSELTVTPGRALAGEEMPDGTIEHGYVTGEDGDASQTLDFTGEPAATYIIYVRPDFSPGVSGSRLFWNSATETEDAAAIDTREVAGWRVVAATSSPGDQYAAVGRAIWDGATFTSTNNVGRHFWEGQLSTTGAESSDIWGDGVNDRNADRATYGVQSLYKAFALVRRQLKDIIGAASGHWGSAIPISLTDTKAHVDLTTDPHGSAPTWTGMPTFDGGINVNGQGDFTGAGYVEVDGKEDLRFGTETGAYCVPAGGVSAFITAGTLDGPAFTDGSMWYQTVQGTAGTNLVIPIHVPVGATLTKVTVTGYWHNQTGGTAWIELYVYEHLTLLGTLNELGDDREDDTTIGGAAASYGTATVSGLSELSITTNAFFAFVEMNNGGETDKIAFISLVAEYEFDNVVG
jgi:hypothetical protein